MPNVLNAFALMDLVKREGNDRGLSLSGTEVLLLALIAVLSGPESVDLEQMAKPFVKERR